MCSLFILGNGFDLAHGLKTKYLDFKEFLIDLYPDADEYCDEQFYFDDFFHMSEDEVATELLFYAMNTASGFEWNDFENALGYIHFYKKFPRRSKEAKEIDDHEDIVSYMLAIDALSNVLIPSTKLWQEFFRCWIKSVEFELEGENHSPKTMLMSLFQEPDNLYLTFNYTKVLQKIYGIKKVIHIHNRAGQKLIFGHGDDKATYTEPFEEGYDGPIGSSFLNDLIMSFRKDTISPMKKYNDFFKSLNKNIDKVYSYGFSYSKADSVYIKTIINKIATDAVWYFTEYEENHKELVRIKKVKLRRYGVTAASSCPEIDGIICPLIAENPAG